MSSEITRLWKYFYEVKKFKKLLCGLSWENFNIGSLVSCNVFLNRIETVSHLEWCFEKVRLTDDKNLKLAKHYYNYYKSFPSCIFDVSVCFAQWQIFVIACVFAIMQFRQLSNLPCIGHLPAFKSTTETLEQSVKSVQS